ncbi:SWIB/MDM2 domain-containing protein [Scenedesmus sp. NREL 46B-D3]|nr:SWIB/MDM2 domain-containing protein [Scenedesmus sp. NREL 46B-D3]
MEPDVEQEQQQQGKLAEPAEVKLEEVKAEEGVASIADSAASEVSDDVLREKLLQMLQESDLSTVTEKMLRKQLEGQLGVKLADKKQLIRQEVMGFLAKQQAQDGEQDREEEEADEKVDEEEQEEEEQEQKLRKRRSNSNTGSVLSEPMQAFVGAESMPRTQVVKAIWDYIKANNLQDPKDKRSIIPDKKLATIITAPVTMFSMNKQISRHVFSRDAIMGGGSDDESEQQPAKKARTSGGAGSSKPKPKPRAKAKGSSEGGDGAKKELKGFAKPQRISDELAAVTGQPEMSRGTLMKWLFAYIKEKDLYDPSNKRYVISDSALQELTGESRFLAFGAQKLFGKHFLK